jgi:hypothetical protein
MADRWSPDLKNAVSVGRPGVVLSGFRPVYLAESVKQDNRSEISIRFAEFVGKASRATRAA